MDEMSSVSPSDSRKGQAEEDGLARWESEQTDLVDLRELLPRLMFDNSRDIMPEALVRGIVVREYALIDLQLASLLFLYYFGVSQEGFEASVRSGRYLSFYELAESVPLVRKLSLLRSVLPIPGQVSKRIQRINDVRNAVAHVAVAEVSSRRKFKYGKERLFSEVGVRRFLFDVSYTSNFLSDTRLKLYKGAVEFKHHGRLLSTYEVLTALSPEGRSCALFADDPDKLGRKSKGRARTRPSIPPA